MRLPSFLTCCFSPKTPSCTELNQSQREAQFQTQDPSTPIPETRTHATGREQRTSFMEIRLRNSLNQAKQENTHGMPPLAAMLSWGKKTFDELCKQGDFATHMEAARARPEKFKQSSATLQKIYNQCQEQAYDLYTREIGREPVLLGENEQEALLSELRKIENDKVYLEVQEPQEFKDNKLTLTEALKIDPKIEQKLNFYIHPRILSKGSSKDGISSRISLSVKPNHVIKVAEKLADEFGRKFNDILFCYKVMAAEGHGQRPDNIVIYLRQTNPERAKQFAKHLNDSIPADAWEQQSPPGMHAFFPGIAYGECPPKTNTSFGRNRAEVIAKAILKHMTDQTPLDDAIKEELKSHKCSLENPAFIDRPGLEAILIKL